jgi:ribulose-bisphosphate carboxylase large chain
VKPSNDRFTATYQITGDRNEALSRAKDICLEQTVEFPDELIGPGLIRDHIIGRIESIAPSALHGRSLVTISYAVEIAAGELTQLINVLFGNISIKPGIRLIDLKLPDSLLAIVKGPRFGRDGLRALLGVSNRPLLCTALKPMGTLPEDLAAMAYTFAMGGIDIIKEDHGLTNQPFAPFEKRVELCAKAIARANAATGLRCMYAPNISAPAHVVMKRARFAREAGAAGLLVAPGIVGLDTMRMIAEADEVGLPILSHPALQGTYVINPDQGISHGVLFGLFNRLAGADAAIYPNYGGRFSFTPEECGSIVDACKAPLGGIKPIFPAPAGGMALKRVPELRAFYGNEAIFLIGGGLLTHGPDRAENCREFVRMVSYR